MTTEDERSRVGQVADKYRVLRLIGQGGMGTVYEAEHIVVGRRFAVKFLNAELARQEDLLARFRREAQAAGRLESENIAQVIDFGHADDGVPFIVMEFLVGEDLARFLAREGPLPLARAAALIIQTCRGLDAAHAAGIVHRDLKPENLFLCKRGDGSDLLKILDFGIAKLTSGADAPSGSVTRTGSTMGTPYYMPPEQARGEKNLDHRADIYAMGVILFEMLTGQKPHPGDSYNAILYHILTQPPVALASLRPELPAELCELVQRTLAPAARDRPESAMALARGVSGFAGRQITPLRSEFELRAASGLDATAPSAPSDHRPATVRAGRGRLWAVAGVVVVAATAVGVLRPWAPSKRAGSVAPAASTAVSASPAELPAPPSPQLPPSPQPPAEQSPTAEVPAVSDRPSRARPGRPRGQFRGGRSSSRAATGEGLSNQAVGDNPAGKTGPRFERDNPYQ